MKYNSLCKSALAVAALCTAFGTIVPFSNTYIEAQETDLSTEQKNGTVGLTKEENGNYTFGNGYLKRTFSITKGKLKTEYLTNYRTSGETKMTPASNEEFVIETMENSQEAAGFKAPTQKIENNNWDVTSDSEQIAGENGNASHMFDGDVNTYYHSKYKDASSEEKQYPHNIYVDLKNKNTFKSVYYKQRVYNGSPTVSGHVKDFKLYTASSIEELKTDKAKLVYEGTFEDKEDNYVNLGKEVTAQYVRIEFTTVHTPKDSGVDKDVACCSEFGFFADEAVFPEKSVSQIKASKLTVDGEPVVGEANGYKTLTFKFKPVTARNVQYTIKEVISMKDGESFMRKHLEIEVPQEQAEQAKIKYIDLENMNFQDSDVKGNGSNQSTDTNYWTIQELQDNPHMANMKGDYLELGQPYYVGSMYWGCEFPQAENKVRDKKGFIRYHYGKNLVVENDKSDGQFHNYNNYNNANGLSGKMITWDAVVGAARSTDYQVVQSDFYEYIETIATKTGFRQQFNSWYDNMKDITDSNIQESFNEIEKGFTQYGVNPLDSYVVDDGWTNYSSFWDFDRSANKFPNELYNSSSQVNKMGSNFGLWLGPRGGYGTERQIANYIANNNLGSRNENSGNDINVSDGRYLDKLVNDIFVDYQNKFDINYWKLDGMLLEPSTNSSNAHTTTDKLCTISETYERWTDMYETMRKNRPDLWINMTSYTNPSPWHVQWVNSVWMQNTGDTGYSYKDGDTDEKAMLTFRDGDYYEFFTKNQWQLPNKYFYNHDPVYAKTAHNVPGGPGRQIEYTTDELREHLYMLGTRGTAFWEYYYSPSMFDNEKWQVNAEAANWIEDNFDILQKSKMFGGDPEKEQVYGYSCWNGNQGIVSIRNPKNVEQTYTLKLDEKVGVSSGVKNVYGKVVVGDQSRQTNDAVSHNTELTYTLKPKEVLIVQYGAKDGTPAKVESMHAEKNKVSVKFDERIQTPEAGNFTVDGNKITDVKLDADLRTAVLTVEKELEDTSDVTVKVNGVKDVVGNVSKTDFTDDYYAKDLINGIGKTTLDGTPIDKGNIYALDGTRGFTVSGEINTTQTNAEIARQDGAFTVGIDGDGYLTFNFNGMSVNSKHTEKTRQNDGSVTESVEGRIADGKKHQFAAVKEENGMIKLYMDGELVNSTYDASKVNPNVSKGNLVFGDGLTGDVEYVTLHDKGLGFDEVGELKPEENVERNVVGSKTNKKVKISAYDVTDKKAVTEKGDRPFSYLNDGKKDTNNYLELNDTSDKTNHSRYVQVDLGDEYELNKIHLTRYYGDSRTYGPTVIELSKNEDFKEKTQVFNSDKDGNVHNLGEGKDDLYNETAGGKEVSFEKTTARYIRVYVNGQANNKSSSDHIVELEAYGVKINADSNKPISPDREINLTHLNELIEQAEKKVKLKEYITTDSLDIMQNALEGAKAVKNNPITQKAVDEACKLLENGLKGLKADKSKLEQRLEDAKAYDGKEEFYTADSWKSFSDALKLAKSESTDEKSTPETVKKAYEDLDKAITGLTYKEVDKTNLNKLIEKAKAYDGKQEFYTEDSWNTFAEALNVANSESTNEKSTPETVKKAYDRLNKAIKGLTYKEVDKTNLNKLIEKAKAYDGKQEFYTEDSWKSFSDALAAAKSEYKSENSTPETVKAAQEKLDAAIKGLKAKKVDKSQLEALIKEAEGKTETDYTAKSWAKLVTALEAARSEFRNENATQESVNNACGSLKTAIDGLTVKADKTQLKALIDEASNKNKAEYTSVSWKALETALKNAQSVYDTEDATQKSVQDACDSLRTAIDGLKVKVDKSELQALITEAKDKKETDYTADSWKVFADALANAEGELKSDKSTPETVKAAQDTLSEAIKGLAPKKQVDKSELQKLIAEATGKEEAGYTPESWAAFTTALGTANEVNGNKDATQEVVDQACESLRTAMTGLTAKADKTQLQALIDEAGNKNKDEYTEESWASFEAALNEAKSVFANENASQDVVDKACESLSKAIEDLKFNKSQLKVVIDQVENKNSEDYTEESWEAFANALAEARAVFEDENATPESVDQAYRKLNEAINGLTVKVNKPELKELIDKAQNKKSEDYTDTSWDAFETALEEAKAVFENEAATSEQISQAYRKLNEAINGLTVKADKSELTKVIASSATLNESDYTPESWKQFKEALDYAYEVSANPNVSQEEVDEAKDKLEKAVKNLVKATGSEQKPTEKPDTKPDTKPEQKPTDKPGTKPEQKPSDKPEEKPTDKPDTKPEQKPTDKPVQKPTEKPSKNNGTNTGTSTHVGFFATTALASATAVLGLFGYKRRNKKK